MLQPLTPELQQAFADTLAQLLSNTTQPSTQMQDQEWWQKCVQNKRLYNAYHDLAEQLYDVLGFQLEQLPDFQGCLLQQILQQGRLPIYAPVQNSPCEKHGVSKNAVESLGFYPQPDTVQAESVHLESEQKQPLTPPNNDNQSILSEMTDLSESNSVEPTHLPLAVTTPIIEKQSSPIPDNASTSLQTGVKTVKKMPHFQIPNARVGQDYQASIQMQHPVKQDVQIHHESVRIPENLGICFDAVTQQLSGIPTQAGEFKLIFQYKTANEQAGWLSGEVTFIVTADPRSLWQVNEPDPNAMYWKANNHCQLIKAADFNIAACSQRGRSHEHAGTFRDDDFFVAQVADSNWSVLVVADGAGSAEFSREGSRVAVNTVGEYLKAFMQKQSGESDRLLAQWQVGANDDPETKNAAHQLGNQFSDAFYSAATQAIEQIEHEATRQGVASKLFATTLLFAVVRQQDNKTFISSFWVGDGAIAVYGKDRVRLMGKPDGGEFAGQTRFLDYGCLLRDFKQRVHIGYFDDAQAVILMTDGISDPRFETDAGLENQQKWQALWQEIEPHLQQEQPEQALLEWSAFFSAGHHDDRTLAILWTVSTSSIHDSSMVTEPVEINGEEHE